MIAISSFHLAILVIASIVNLLLMISILKRDWRSATSRVFALLSATTVIWFLLMYLSVNPLFLNWSLWLVRASIFFAVPMTMLFYFLAEVTPGSSFTLSKNKTWASILSSLFVMFLALGPFVFKDVEIVSGTPIPQPGIGLAFFAFLTTLFSILAVYTLLKKYKNSQGIVKGQLKLMIVGMGVMFTLIILTILLPAVFFRNNFFVIFAPLYVLFFLSMTAIAIAKYKMFDIRVIATEAGVVALVLLLVFEGLLSGSVFAAIYKVAFAIMIGFVGSSVVRSAYAEVRAQEELKSMAEALRNANLRLQQLDRQKTEFLSIASHQLRTPLSIIKGYIELIEDGAFGRVTKKMGKVLGDMDESNERLVKLVDEFLDITRIEQGRTKFNFAPASLNDLVTSVVAEQMPRAVEKNIKLVWNKIETFPKVTMDEEKIRHVVFNFVDNAIKYSEKGSVRVSVEQENEGVKVQVFDQGLGFEEKDQANFFQKFYRGENVKGSNVGGTGLGIYVCKKFIDAHRGEVWAKSGGLGKGSEFGFWIPLNQ